MCCMYMCIYGVLFACLSKRICVTFLQNPISVVHSRWRRRRRLLWLFFLSEITYSPVLKYIRVVELYGLLFNFYYFGFRSIVN